jgi:RHS repeat-associated core domain
MNRYINKYRHTIFVILITLCIAVCPAAFEAKGGNLPTGLNKNENYVLSQVFLLPAANSTAITTIQYVDGLGRPVQTVQQGVTPTGADLVDLTEYDDLGRESKKWLPIPVSGNNGNIMAAESFTGTASSYYNDQNPYLQTEYETSPLNRVIARQGAGQDWSNAQRKNQIDYQTNVASDVRLYQVTGNAVAQNGYYTRGTLYVTQATDEEQHVVYEFKDQQGRVVLKRAVAETGNHDTYYIFDDYGDLRFVLPPKAEGAVGATTLSQLAYQYQYDSRHRCVAKKLPGADWINMVYDNADRLVLSQDGNQRDSSWCSFTKYDVLGRVIQTGILKGVSSGLQSEVATYKNIVVTESRTGSNDYTNTSQPITNTTILTVNYYDNYNYPGAIAAVLAKGFDPPYLTSSKTNTGMLTGSKVALMDNPTQKLVTTLYYDDHARPVQALATNHLGGVDYEYFRYSFTGQPLRKRHEHKSPYVADTITEDYTFTYDQANRLLNTYHKLNNRKDSVLLSSLTYDELGRVSNKSLHSGLESINYGYNIRGWIKSITSPKFAETLYYQDQLDGKPTCFNGNISAVKWGNAATQDKKYYFSYDNLNRLTNAVYSPYQIYSEQVTGYDKNGNILGITRTGWVFNRANNTVMPGLIDNLFLSYTGNQLTNINDAVLYLANIPLGLNDYEIFPYTTSNIFKYDKNGNQTVNRDKRISWMKYNSLNLPQKIQFYNGNKNEYSHDAAGVKHQSRYLSSTVSMQIPMASTTENTANITLSSKTDYCGNYIYENGVLKRILTPEGYILTTGATSKWQYTYALKDHQGNTRYQFASDSLSRPTSKVYTYLGATDYYPFGMEMSDNYGKLSSYGPYLYNNKEMDRMNGLNMLDYGARWYDGTIGRWSAVDPLAEKRNWDSPFSYCGNNPFNRIDPTGMIWENQEDADKLKANIDNEVKSLNKSIENNEAALKKDGLSEKAIGSINKKITEAKDRISNLAQSKNDIDRLGADQDNTYAFSNTNGGEHNVFKGSDGNVYIQKSSDAMAIHEITHVRQSLVAGGLKFSPDGKLYNAGNFANTLGDKIKQISGNEIEAYKMQYSMDGSFPGHSSTLQGINVHTVGDIVNDNGKYIYPLINAYSSQLKQQALFAK